jgi:2,4-dienoyl-CoA reductase-like NADH-dependent reductase (Old Yellow Enzyme family)
MSTGKSNNRQFMLTEETFDAVKQLREDMVKAHAEKFGTADDLYIGLQLTHSGRYSHPNDDAKLESVTAYEHPLLDERFHCTADNVLKDEDIPEIVAHYGKAAKLAQKAGFDFVDITTFLIGFFKELISEVNRVVENLNLLSLCHGSSFTIS